MLPTSTHILFFGDKQYVVHNENELALIIDLLSLSPESYELHRHLIMSLDEELMDIIQSYKGLLLCMKNMEFKNRFLLLVKVGDQLSCIVEKSVHLGSILAGIPEEADKIRIIKSIRAKGLVQIIHIPDDLGNILEWIFGEGELVIFEMLGEDFLKSLFAYGTDIYKVFHFLSSENKDTLADILSLPFMKSIIYTAEDFFYVLKALSNDKAREFMELFSPLEIRKIIKKNETLHHFLPKITEEKEFTLLKYIQL